MNVRRPRGLLPLRHPRFRLLVAGQLGSNVGDAFYAVALPWYVLSTHGGVVLLATVLAAYGVPRTVLLAVGGHASDRWRPWTVMMASDTVRCAVLVALAVVAATATPEAATLVPIAAVLGAGEGLFLPGSMAIVPSLLPGDDLQAGNALSSGALQLATLIGPGIGGVVVAFGGASIAFAIDAASFALSAITLLGIRRASEPALSVIGEIDHAPSTRDGPDRPDRPDRPSLREVLTNERVLWVILAVSTAANLGSGGMAEVALPALAHGPLRSGAAGYGVIVAGFGAGALIGTLVAAQLRTPSRPAVVASISFLIEAAAMAATPFLGTTGAVAGALVVIGACNGFGNVLTLTVFQRWAPPHLIGRLSGLIMLASYGVFPISVLSAGLVVHADGPTPLFLIAAALLAVALAGGLTQRSWRQFGVANPSAPAAPATRTASTL